MIIRLAGMDDLPRLQELVASSAAELEQYGTATPIAAMVSVIAAGIRDGDAVVVAEQEGAIVGFTARVHLPGMPEERADGIGRYVLPDYRRDHVDRDMQQFAEQHARRLGRRYIDGSIAVGNLPSLNACLGDGYRIIGYLVRKEIA